MTALPLPGSTDNECRHGMVDADCSLCHPRTSPNVVDLYPFTARYESTCSGCGLPVYPGQRARAVPDGPVFHEGCQ